MNIVKKYFVLQHLRGRLRSYILTKIRAWLDGDKAKYRVLVIACRVVRFKIYRVKNNL